MQDTEGDLQSREVLAHRTYIEGKEGVGIVQRRGATYQHLTLSWQSAVTGESEPLCSTCTSFCSRKD